LDERLLPQYLPRLDAVLNPGVDSLVVDVLESFDVGTIGGLDIIESVEGVEMGSHMNLHVSVRVIRINEIATCCSGFPPKVE
jgi:hypothetical protein